MVHSSSPSTSSSHSSLSGVGEAGGRGAEGEGAGAVARLLARSGEHGGSSDARCEGEGGGSSSGGSSGSSDGSSGRSLAPEAGPIAPLLPPPTSPPQPSLPRLLPPPSSPSSPAVRYIACSCCIRRRRCAGTDAAAAGLGRRAAAAAAAAAAVAAERDGPVADQGRCCGTDVASGGSAGAAAAACGAACGVVRVWLARPRLCMIGTKRGAQRSRLRIPSSSDWLAKDLKNSRSTANASAPSAALSAASGLARRLAARRSGRCCNARPSANSCHGPMYNEGDLPIRAAAAFSLSLRWWEVRRREAAVEELSVDAAEAVESPLVEAQGDGGGSRRRMSMLARHALHGTIERLRRSRSPGECIQPTALQLVNPKITEKRQRGQIAVGMAPSTAGGVHSGEHHLGGSGSAIVGAPTTRGHYIGAGRWRRGRGMRYGGQYHSHSGGTPRLASSSARLSTQYSVRQPSEATT